MKTTEMKKDDLITLSLAAKITGVSLKNLKYQIEQGTIKTVEDMIQKSDCDLILEQKNTFIGMKAFLKEHDNERFVSKYAKNRNKYIDFLEENQYFGIEIVEPEDILFELPEKEDFYITKEDAQLLEYESELFFKEFGLTEEEKVRYLIMHSPKKLLSARYINKYLTYINDEDNIYVPSLTAFVRTVLDMPDIKQLRDEDIVSVIEDTDVLRTKMLLVDFFRFVARYEDVRYHNVKLKKKESNSEPAYPYEKFVKLAKILFNADYDREHDLTLNAFKKSKYIEMWMFLSCHYICGWRSSDICDRWIYLNLKNNNNPFKINIDTLKEDILNENITDETYEKIALYAIKRIEMAYYLPQKTGIGKLRAEMVPELRVFFGKLILIAEYHHITSNEGYMNSHRAASYRNWVFLKEFFGEEIYKITGRQSISSRRLNKSYLQGLSQVAKDNGNTTLVAHVVASFARNHSNIDTTSIYLKDHGLSGESAEVVLYMMMQRGVFSVSLYHALIAAYPEAFEKLSAKEQTAIMNKIPLSAYEIETVGPSILASVQMSEGFANGKTDEPKELLKTMFAIAQGKGKAKDEGIFCKKKALGYACENPIYESCLANLCPYHVFTSDGIPALAKVIKDYKIKALTTGNKKYQIALNKKIYPAFYDIINAILKEMSEKDREGLKKLMGEVFNG